MLKNRRGLHIDCDTCSVNNLCLVNNLTQDEVAQLNEIITNVKMINKGEHLFHTNDKMQNIYAVYTGSCKAYWLDENGNERVDNFYFPGDIIGLESMPNRQHLLSLTALEESQVCVIPLDDLFDLMQRSDKLLRRIMHIASFKMQNDYHVRITTNANQRIADFILNILNRMQERKQYNVESLTLPMSQLDISNFLGMAHETVNRILKKLCVDNIIRIENKVIYILNVQALQNLGSPLRFPGQV